MNEIQKAKILRELVAAEYGIAFKKQRGRSTSRHAVARQILANIFIHNTGLTLREIGDLIGCNHTSVIYNFRKTSDRQWKEVWGSDLNHFSNQLKTNI